MYIGSSPNFGALDSQTITSANGSTATFTLNQYVPDSDSIIVTVGNVVQEPTEAYTASGNSITFTENVPNGDTIVIRYLGRSVDVYTGYKRVQRFKFVATNGQQTFSGSDANSNTLAYTVQDIDVFYNGVRLDESEFTASNGTSVILGTGATTSAELVILAYKVVQLADTVPASTGGTFTGNVVFSGNATVNGNLTASGTTTLVDTTNTVVKDNLLGLNHGATSNSNDAGIIVERGSTGNDALLIWDESEDKWALGTTTSNASSTGNLNMTTGTLVANLEGTIQTASQTNITAVGTLSSATVSGDLTVDTSTLKVDSSNNRVGIGTASPATALDVSGSGTDYIATFQNTTSATGYGVLIKEPLNASAGYPLLAITDGQANTVRFRVDSSTGHVGVNRAPTANDTVHINDTTPRIKLEETSSGGSKMLVLGVETDGTPFIDAPQSGGNIEFKCVGVPAMQITRTGDTNNPAEFRIKGGSGSLHQCITGTNWGYSTGYEAFMMGRDDTASEGTFSFGYNPRVNANAGFTGDGREIIFRRGMRFYTPNASNNGFFNQFTLLDGVASGDFNDTSDEKLKENIKDVSEGISIIKQLRPVIFDWKDEAKGNGLGGFIAQEVQKILPNDVMGEEYVAPDKEKDIEGTDGLSINTTSIVAHLTKALQEAITKIETLEAKVKALEEA